MSLICIHFFTKNVNKFGIVHCTKYNSIASPEMEGNKYSRGKDNCSYTKCINFIKATVVINRNQLQSSLKKCLFLAQLSQKVNLVHGLYDIGKNQ